MRSARRLQETTDKASTNPDIFMGVAQILNLFWEHDQRALPYEKTITGLWKALSKGKVQITNVITMMENLNLLRVEAGGNQDKTIHLIGEKDFMERAMSIHHMLAHYSNSDEMQG